MGKGLVWRTLECHAASAARNDGWVKAYVGWYDTQVLRDGVCPTLPPAIVPPAP